MIVKVMKRSPYLLFVLQTIAVASIVKGTVKNNITEPLSGKQINVYCRDGLHIAHASDITNAAGVFRIPLMITSIQSQNAQTISDIDLRLTISKLRLHPVVFQKSRIMNEARLFSN